MRFKKIEISAFRIYDKPEDATFDFTGPKGSAANFVSLYAPNGFGKTSFYDAVEWAITKNVSRFWQNKTVNSSINTQKENNAAQVKVLRNTNSSIKTKSYVKVTTEDGELPVRNLVIHGNKKADLENEDICENEDFRKVILSQEWISGFLKEVDGECRFELFMKNPDLKDLNEYYRDVKGLIAANQTNIDGMETKRAGEIAKVVEVAENNLLELINDTIKELNRSQEELSAIKIDTSATEALTFANAVSARLVEINKQLQELHDYLARINAIESGTESLTGIVVYFENKARRQKIEADLATISALITRFEELSKRQNELKTTQETHSALLKALDDINRIAAAFGNYLRTEKSINDKFKQCDAEQKKRDELTQPLEKFIGEESELKGRINTISANIIDTENKILNFPTLKLAYESLQDSFKKSEEDIKTEKEKELKATEEKERLLIDLNMIEAQLSAFSAKNYKGVGVKLPAILKTLMEDIPKNYASLSKLEEQLTAINQEITQQASYNQNLQDFIQKGLELIRVSQTKDCPFCDYTYENYQELAAKATSNPQLSSSEQSMVKLKNDTIEQITALTQKIAADEKTITDFFNQLMGDIRQQIQGRDLLIAEAKRIIVALIRTQERHKKDIAQISSQLNGLELENYLQNLQQELEKLKTELQVQVNALQEVQEKMNPLREALQISQVKTGIFNDDIVKFQDESDYKLVLLWFKENSLERQGDNKLIMDKVNDLLSRNNIKKEEIATLQKAIEQLTKDLAEENSKELLTKQRALKNEREALIKLLTAYEQLANLALGEDIKGMSKEQVEQAINKAKQTAENSIKSVVQKHTAYSKLQQYNANLYPFLQTAQAKATVAKLDAEILFLREQIVPLLEDEKNKIKKHLEDRVKSYFYTDLINRLYNKIDPHPDFKAVEFKANFDIDNPTLDVLVTDENKQKVLIPNLYFSTAQTNILSLSIFLASALNSKNYDCIFIDDPIQSMDSINLLSTIDLIRSIVINEKKQVILSTHDSNFHNLLKRKMPPQLFNSKFLELESFGKVKVENVN